MQDCPSNGRGRWQDNCCAPCMTSLRGLGFGIFSLFAAHFLLCDACSGQEPRFAGAGPAVNVSIGYIHLDSEVPSAGMISQNGIASGVTMKFTYWLSIKLEVSYTRTYDAFDLHRHSDMLAYLGGPIVYPLHRKRFSIYAQALIGAARITGVIPESATRYLSGQTNKLAWSVGPGVEAKLSRATVFRLGADYLHAAYFNPGKSMRGQQNIRFIASLAYTLGKFH